MYLHYLFSDLLICLCVQLDKVPVLQGVPSCFTKNDQYIFHIMVLKVRSVECHLKKYLSCRGNPNSYARK